MSEEGLGNARDGEVPVHNAYHVLRKREGIFKGRTGIRGSLVYFLVSQGLINCICCHFSLKHAIHNLKPIGLGERNTQPYLSENGSFRQVLQLPQQLSSPAGEHFLLALPFLTSSPPFSCS